MTGRLVWINDKQRDAAARECTATSYGLNTLMHLWDAAPADPAEAVRKVIVEHGCFELYSHGEATAVLRALGVPRDE